MNREEVNNLQEALDRRLNDANQLSRALFRSFHKINADMEISIGIMGGSMVQYGDIDAVLFSIEDLERELSEVNDLKQELYNLTINMAGPGLQRINELFDRVMTFNDAVRLLKNKWVEAHKTFLNTYKLKGIIAISDHFRGSLTNNQRSQGIRMTEREIHTRIENDYRLMGGLNDKLNELHGLIMARAIKNYEDMYSALSEFQKLEANLEQVNAAVRHIQLYENLFNKVQQYNVNVKQLINMYVELHTLLINATGLEGIKVIANYIRSLPNNQRRQSNRNTTRRTNAAAENAPGFTNRRRGRNTSYSFIPSRNNTSSTAPVPEYTSRRRGRNTSYSFTPSRNNTSSTAPGFTNRRSGRRNTSYSFTPSPNNTPSGTANRSNNQQRNNRTRNNNNRRNSSRNNRRTSGTTAPAENAPGFTNRRNSGNTSRNNQQRNNRTRSRNNINRTRTRNSNRTAAAANQQDDDCSKAKQIADIIIGEKCEIRNGTNGEKHRQAVECYNRIIQKIQSNKNESLKDVQFVVKAIEKLRNLPPRYRTSAKKLAQVVHPDKTSKCPDDMKEAAQIINNLKDHMQS